MVIDKGGTDGTHKHTYRLSGLHRYKNKDNWLWTRMGQTELADTHPGHLVCTGTKTRITVTGYEYGLGRWDRQLEIAKTHQGHLVCRDKTRIADYGHTLGRQNR